MKDSSLTDEQVIILYEWLYLCDIFIKGKLVAKLFLRYYILQLYTGC